MVEEKGGGGEEGEISGLSTRRRRGGFVGRWRGRSRLTGHEVSFREQGGGREKRRLWRREGRMLSIGLRAREGGKTVLSDGKKPLPKSLSYNSRHLPQ